MDLKTFIKGMSIITIVVILYFIFGNPVLKGPDLEVKITQVYDITTTIDEEGNVVVYVK